MYRFRINIIQVIYLIILSLYIVEISSITFYKGDPGELGDVDLDLVKLEQKARHKRNVLGIPASTTLTFQNKISSPLFKKFDGNISGSGNCRLYLRYTFPDDIGILGRSRRAIDRERSLTYSTLAEVLDSFGLNGTDCLLKSVCETADNPIRGYGILDDLIQMFLSPSHNLQYEMPTLLRFLDAEKHGRHVGNCEEKYKECRIPFADMVHAGISSMIETASTSKGKRHKLRNEL